MSYCFKKLQPVKDFELKKMICKHFSNFMTNEGYFKEDKKKMYFSASPRFLIGYPLDSIKL